MTSSKALQEILQLYQRRCQVALGATLVRPIHHPLPTIRAVDGDDQLDATALGERYPDLPARDWVHASRDIRHGARAIIRADKHFDRIEGVDHFDPSLA